MKIIILSKVQEKELRYLLSLNINAGIIGPWLKEVYISILKKFNK